MPRLKTQWLRINESINQSIIGIIHWNQCTEFENEVPVENKREIRKMAARRSQKRGSEGTACVFFARFVFKYFFVTILDEMKLFFVL